MIYISFVIIISFCLIKGFLLFWIKVLKAFINDKEQTLYISAPE